MRQSWKSGALALTLAAGAHLALFSLNWPQLPSEPAPETEPAVTVELEVSSARPAPAPESASPETVTTSGKSSHQVAISVPAEASPPEPTAPKAPVAAPKPSRAPAKSTAAADNTLPSQSEPIETEVESSQAAPPATSISAPPAAPDKPAPTTRVISLSPAQQGGAKDAASGGRTQGRGTDPGAARSGYRQLLESHLNQYQRYPLNAQRKQQTGTVEVAFVIDRQGHLVSSELLSRTPFPLLNREALALLRRAVPFPPVPDTLTDDQLRWELPIEFRLN